MRNRAMCCGQLYIKTTCVLVAELEQITYKSRINTKRQVYNFIKNFIAMFILCKCWYIVPLTAQEAQHNSDRSTESAFLRSSCHIHSGRRCRLSFCLDLRLPDRILFVCLSAVNVGYIKGNPLINYISST